MKALDKLITDGATIVQEHGAVAQDAHGTVAGQEESIGEVLMHHVTNSPYFEFFHYKLALPHFELFGIDMSISKHAVMLWIAALLVFVVFKFGMKWKDMVPANRLTGFFEPLVIFIRDEVVYQSFGKAGKPFVPFFLSIFFFILFVNLLGLIPFSATATGNINVTAGLAVVSFALIQIAGMAKNGVIQHWVNLVPSGIPKALIPIMIPVELMGMIAKPFALCIRLFANMVAGHIVIFSFLGLIILLKNIMIGAVAIPLAVGISLMEVFIGFLQAYIFTFLTAIFVSMSYHPDH